MSSFLFFSLATQKLFLEKVESSVQKQIKKTFNRDSLKELRRHLVEPELTSILQLIQGINEEKLFVYPTDTIFGLGTSIFSYQGTKRLFSLKRRPENLPLSLCVPSKEAIYTLTSPGALAKKMISLFLPGPITLVLKARTSFWKEVPSTRFFLKNGKVGIRLLPDPFFNALLHFTGPVSTTSANLHGKPSPSSFLSIVETLGKEVDYYTFWFTVNKPLPRQKESFLKKCFEKLESYLYKEEKTSSEKIELRELTRGQQIASTVVEIEENQLRILREGAISGKEIEAKIYGR